MNEAAPEHGLSVHRSEALTDGIYAVAMTLLVIELKLPEVGALHSDQELGAQLLVLLPKFYAWVMSFGVLAIFWIAHHRAFSGVRRTDGRLIVFNIGQLAFVSLMPFSCALLGEHGTALAQIVYSSNMVLLALFALLTLSHIHHHTELSAVPLSRASYNGARVRIFGLIAISLLAVAIQWMLPGAVGIGSAAFALMALIVPLSRRAERAATGHAALTVTP